MKTLRQKYIGVMRKREARPELHTFTSNFLVQLKREMNSKPVLRIVNLAPHQNYSPGNTITTSDIELISAVRVGS